MCRGRTCVKGCGVPLGIAQIVGALADNPPLPRLVRACGGIHWAPGCHSVAPGVGAGPVEGIVLAGVPGGVGPMLLAGASCKQKALSNAALSCRTSGVQAVLLGLALIVVLIVAVPVHLAHACCTAGSTSCSCSCVRCRSQVHLSAGRQGLRLGLMPVHAAMPNPLL